jgi:hypothetical protein
LFLPINPLLRKIVDNLSFKCENYGKGCVAVLKGCGKDIEKHQFFEC